MDKLMKSAICFVCEEDGSQVVEYALVIALVAIVLALALSSAVSGLSVTFSDLADRLSICFTSTLGTC